MISRRTKSWAVIVAAGAASMVSAFSQGDRSPILLHRQSQPDTVAVARYRHIRVEEFRKLVIGAFESSRFSFVGFATTKQGALQYRFAYSVTSEEKAGDLVLVLRVDENLDKNKRCADCFLRLAELPNLREFESLPRMAQYTLSSRIFPGIDRAFERIRVDGRPHMDASFGFTYRDQWQGERNVHGNSFVGVGLPQLKAMTIDAYQDAGFVFDEYEQRNPSADAATLRFVFPLDPGRAVGALYRVVLVNQFDAIGACNPCEMRESFDPHQTLPASGLSGMASRLTLESRFSHARALAHEKLKDATERYLRPGSVFTVPPQPAPLGSPRPTSMPMAVT